MKIPTNLSWDQNLAKEKQFKARKQKRSLIWKVTILFTLLNFIDLFVCKEFICLSQFPKKGSSYELQSLIQVLSLQSQAWDLDV